MDVRRCLLAALVAAGGATSAVAPPGHAGPFLPVGSGAWAGSPNVTQSGGCSGVTTSTTDCTISVTVTDGAAGSYAVPVRVLVTSGGWKMQGHLVALDTSTTRVVVLDVAATVSPGCSAVRLRDGSVSITFHGVFSGSYQFL